MSAETSIRREAQTVTPAGERLMELPQGTAVRDLVTQTDERGTICELFDPRWGIQPDPMVYAYACTLRPGLAKGWGMHLEHHDRYAFLSGELELVLYDAREDASTTGLISTIVLSEHRRRLITIPAGVWHAERNIGSSDVLFVNFPTRAYEHARPDKYKLPLDTHELPVESTRGWRGG